MGVEVVVMRPSRMPGSHMPYHNMPYYGICKTGIALSSGCTTVHEDNCATTVLVTVKERQGAICLEVQLFARLQLVRRTQMTLFLARNCQNVFLPNRNVNKKFLFKFVIRNAGFVVVSDLT